MGLMMCDGKFVSRDEVAMVPTPSGTDSWKPVPHMEVIEAVTDVVTISLSDIFWVLSLRSGMR